MNGCNVLRVILMSAGLLPCAALCAQNVVFDLHQSGQEVGTDTFAIAKAKTGYKMTGHLKGAGKMKDLDFKENFTLDDKYMYMEGSLVSQDTNSQFSYLPSKDRKELTIAVSGAGKTSSNFEPINGTDLALLPPFDAGAVQALLLMAVTHPTADNLYNVYLTPGYGLGGGGRSGPPPQAAGTPPLSPDETLPPGQHCFSALWTKGGDVTGTLDGKAVNLHSYRLAFGKFRWIVFADTENNLMQVNVSLLKGSYIRQGFKLDPIK